MLKFHRATPLQDVVHAGIIIGSTLDLDDDGDG